VAGSEDSRQDSTIEDNESPFREPKRESVPPGGVTRHGILNGKSRLLLLSLVGVAVVALGFVYWMLFLRNRVSTDDAYVHADDAQISSRIPGTVLKLLVDNNYPVKVGQVLFVLDPADYTIAVEKARATLVESEAEVKASEVAITVTDAQTAAQVQGEEAALRGSRDKEKEAVQGLAELRQQREGITADLQLALKDFDRFENLYQRGAGSEQRRDEARTKSKKVQSQLGSLDAKIAAAESSLAGASKGVQRAAAQLQEAQSVRSNVEIQRHKLAALKGVRDKAKAELDAAELNLSYCTVTAPIDGYIAQRSVQLGDRVQAGQPLMSVVPLEKVYIQANFKETQLTDVRLGQPVTITADIYPGYIYHGKVIGIGSGTGAAFSLLPAENATGNWIKVVRRVPVKIRLDEPPHGDHPLRVGLSLEVVVDTSNKSGALLVPASSAPPPQFVPSALSMEQPSVGQGP